MCSFPFAKRPFGELIPFVLAVAGSFGVYCYTLCPTVYAGDSGELSLACFTLGIPHPPGYPLFTLIGRLLCTLRIAEPACMTNMSSAVFASLSVGMLFLLLKRITGMCFIALTGALIFGFSGVFWSQAVITEVYTLLCLSFVGLLLNVEVIERRGERKHLYLLAYLSGLACVLHQSMVLFLPAAVYVFFRYRKRYRTPFVVFLFIFGLTPFLLLLIRSHANPVIDWGDPEAPGAFIHLLVRKSYGPLRQNPVSAGLFLGNVQAFFTILLATFPVWLLVLSPFGIAHIGKQRKRFSNAIIIVFFSILFGLILMVNPFPDRVHLYQLSFLYLPLYMIFALWIGAGATSIAGFLKSAIAHAGSDSPGRAAHSGSKQGNSSKKGRFWVGSTVRALPMYFCAAAVIFMFVMNFASINRRDFFDARVYGENILRQLPPGAALFVDGDNEAFIVGYLHFALGLRPDVTIYHRKGYIFSAPGYLKRSSRSDLSKNMRRWECEVLERFDDVYFATYCDLTPNGDWELEREGILYRAVKRSPVLDNKGRDRARLISCDMSVLERNPFHLDFLVRKFAIGYLQSLWDFERKEGREARVDRLLGAIGEVGFDFAEAQYMIGFEMEKLGNYRHAYEAYMAAARLDPRAPFPQRGIERVRGFIEVPSQSN